MNRGGFWKRERESAWDLKWEDRSNCNPILGSVICIIIGTTFSSHYYKPLFLLDKSYSNKGGEGKTMGTTHGKMQISIYSRT